MYVRCPCLCEIGGCALRCGQRERERERGSRFGKASGRGTEGACSRKEKRQNSKESINPRAPTWCQTDAPQNWSLEKPPREAFQASHVSLTLPSLCPHIALSLSRLGQVRSDSSLGVPGFGPRCETRRNTKDSTLTNQSILFPSFAVQG